MEACRLYSKFSARPSTLEVIPSVVEKVVDGLIVVFLSSLLLDYKNGKCKLFLFVYFVQRLFAAACMDVRGPVMLTLQATW